MRSLIVSMILVVSALGMTGCRESEESFGEILTDMSEAPGSDKPYKLPDLGEIEADEGIIEPNEGQGPPSGQGEQNHSGHAHE